VSKNLQAHGRTPNLPLNNDPASGWKPADGWQSWGTDLPNAYVYRLRAVDKDGKPLPLPQAQDTNERGLLYVGETGVKDTDPSSRVKNLARGVTDESQKHLHSAAPKYWDDGWPQELEDLDPDYVLQIGWDEQIDEQIIAEKDARLPSAPQKDQMISHSGKAAAMGLEDAMLRQFASEHPVRPPLNDAPSPGWRDRDRKTKHQVTDDLDERNEGEVDMGDPYGQKNREIIDTNKASKTKPPDA